MRIARTGDPELGPRDDQRRLVDEMKNIAASAQKTYDANDALVTSLKKQMDGAKSDAGSATLDEASIESMVRDTVGGEALMSNFLAMPPSVGGGMQLRQALARYTWDGESAVGLVERSITPKQLT